MKDYEMVLTIPIQINAKDEQEALKKTKHFLEWLSKEPLTAIAEFVTIYEVEK